MSVSTFIARRYLLSKRGTSAVGIITAVSIFGIGVAVFALFVVLSVFSALRQMNISYMSVMDPDMRVRPAQGKIFVLDSVLRAQILSVDGIESISSVLEEKVFARYGENEVIARVKGVDAHYPDVINIDTVMVDGTWLTESQYYPQAILGTRLGYELGLGRVDYDTLLHLYVPSGATQIGLPTEDLFSNVQVKPTGVFSYREYDANYIFVDISIVRDLLARGADQVSFVELKLKDGTDPESISSELQGLLGDKYVVKTREQEQGMYSKIVNTENAVLYFVFTLILIIAMFNVVGSVVMLIIDKSSNIKTLHSIGAPMSMIKNIFIKEGMMIVVVLTVSTLAYASAMLSVSGMKNILNQK